MHIGIIAVFLTGQGKRRRVTPPFPYHYEPICKPGSVLTVIYLGAPLPVRSSHPGDGRASLVSSAVLLRIEFTAMDTSAPSGELLPHLSTLTAPADVPCRLPHRKRYSPSISLCLHSFRITPERIARRYISVALFLKSPSAGVTRYPCPVEPGLSSSAGFRLAAATV